MQIMPHAKRSPRLENGCLYWYAGDTFALQLELLLEDQDGAPAALGADDTVTVAFFDETDAQILEQTFADIADNTVTLQMDETRTALFPRGDYRFDVRYTYGPRTTVLHRSHCHVE